MINVKDIKQRSLIAIREKYKKEIEVISQEIKNAANNGEFMIYYNPRNLRLERAEWTGILNVFYNLGFITGIKDNKLLLISWFDKLNEINLLENYETPEID